MATFGILLKDFGRWQDPMNGTLSCYECRLSGGDNYKTLPAVIEFISTFCTLQVVGMLKCLLVPTHGREPPCETFTTFYLIFCQFTII